jgi:hypothetical protein
MRVVNWLDSRNAHEYRGFSKTSVVLKAGKLIAERDARPVSGIFNSFLDFPACYSGVWFNTVLRFK